MAVACVAFSEGHWEAVKGFFIDYKDSSFFKERTRYYFQFLLNAVIEGSKDGSAEAATRLLSEEWENVKYYAVSNDSGFKIANLEGNLSSMLGSDGLPVLPDGYQYCWYFDGEKVWVLDHGQPVDTRRMDSGYRGIVPDPVANYDESVSNMRVLLAIKDVLVPNPYGYSAYYRDQRFLFGAGRSYIALCMLGLGMFTYGMIRRNEKRAFDRKLASRSGKMWFETKALLSLLVLGLVVMSVRSLLTDIFGIGIAAAVILLGVAWFYTMLVDLITHGKGFFAHNSLNSAIAWYRNYERKYPWQKMMLKRAYALVAVDGFLALLAVCFLMTRDFVFFMFAMLLSAAGVFFTYRYYRRYEHTISELGLLMDHIERVKNGDMETKLVLPPDSDIYVAAQNLNFIQQGMSRAVRDMIKSEKMKVDLITNVSHDLKTPLTSIISYVDLLAKEENLPEHVKDYIRILSQKTERLKSLIQDLFDLSKATSDNMNLDMEKIDLVRLLNQTLAEMDESIVASGLAVKVNIPDEPVFIVSDGKKLYRVFQNLISNALKYSLQGSRVFIDLTVASKEAVVTIKNTANYEMDFTEDEILERFARGDKSRSSEGSGLGLSIAKTFTEACGGRFSIKIDGDLFKVELRFDTAQ